jgi:hypothetical protein
VSALWLSLFIQEKLILVAETALFIAVSQGAGLAINRHHILSRRCHAKKIIERY